VTSGRIGKDKIAHFFGCLVLMLGLGLFMHMAFALLITGLVAVSKEVWDYLGDKQVDTDDLAVDFAGILLGVIILMAGGIAIT
jgi:hypothetical protein